MSQDMSTHLINEVKAFHKELKKEYPEASFNLKENALSEFEKLGLPDKKEEIWKYTNASSFLDSNLKLPALCKSQSANRARIRGSRIGGAIAGVAGGCCLYSAQLLRSQTVPSSAPGRARSRGGGCVDPRKGIYAGSTRDLRGGFVGSA